MSKLYHMAAPKNVNGKVSALCFDPPKEIDLAKAFWTVRPLAVTCPMCIKIMKEQAKEDV